MDDLMNLCCGPRLLSKALGLHGGDSPAAAGDNDPSARPEPRQ
jgi:hypothetical protein